jgi:hypothetical protein
MRVILLCAMMGALAVSGCGQRQDAADDAADDAAQAQATADKAKSEAEDAQRKVRDLESENAALRARQQQQPQQ